jgi:hypothetical protein
LSARAAAIGIPVAMTMACKGIIGGHTGMSKFPNRKAEIPEEAALTPHD